MGWKYIAYLMLSRLYEDFYNSRCSLSVFFFLSALDDFKKKKSGVHFYVFDDIMFSIMCRTWLDVLWWLLVKWVSENHDKSGHKFCLVCPHNSGKRQLKLKLRQLHGRWVLGRQISRKRVPNSIKMCSAITLVSRINEKDFSIKYEGHRKVGDKKKASTKRCEFIISWH